MTALYFDPYSLSKDETIYRLSQLLNRDPPRAMLWLPKEFAGIRKMPYKSVWFHGSTSAA